MSKLQKGKLYISGNDIIESLGLTSDTIINSVVTSNGSIEIDVIASSENKQDWLVESTNSEWNMRRHRLHVSEAVVSKESGFITGGFITLNKDETVLNNQQTKDLFTSMKAETFGKYEEDNETHTEEELLDVLEKIIDKRVEEAIKLDKLQEVLKSAGRITDSINKYSQ